jgi:hypothetical protein
MRQTRKWAVPYSVSGSLWWIALITQYFSRTNFLPLSAAWSSKA